MTEIKPSAQTQSPATNSVSTIGVVKGAAVGLLLAIPAYALGAFIRIGMGASGRNNPSRDYPGYYDEGDEP